MKFELFDVVVLNEGLTKLGLRQGNIGTIVEVLDTDNFVVEFIDRDGKPYAETVLKSNQLLKVFYEPVAA